MFNVDACARVVLKKIFRLLASMETTLADINSRSNQRTQLPPCGGFMHGFKQTARCLSVLQAIKQLQVLQCSMCQTKQNIPPW